MSPDPVVLVLNDLMTTDISLPDAIHCFGAPVDAACLMWATQVIQILVVADVLQLVDTQHTPEIVCPLWVIDSLRKDPTTWIATHPWETFLLRSTLSGRHRWTHDREDLLQRLRVYLNQGVSPD